MEIVLHDKNMLVMRSSKGSKVLFSYNTPVAICSPEGEWAVTSKRHSVSTTRHINGYVPEQRQTIAQSVLDDLVHKL